MRQQVLAAVFCVPRPPSRRSSWQPELGIATYCRFFLRDIQRLAPQRLAPQHSPAGRSPNWRKTCRTQLWWGKRCLTFVVVRKMMILDLVFHFNCFLMFSRVGSEIRSNYLTDFLLHVVSLSSRKMWNIATTTLISYRYPQGDSSTIISIPFAWYVWYTSHPTNSYWIFSFHSISLEPGDDRNLGLDLSRSGKASSSPRAKCHGFLALRGDVRIGPGTRYWSCLVW